MAYGLKYQASFDSFRRTGYWLGIYQKDYEGTATDIVLGEVPVEHSWPEDDVFTPINGSELIIQILNQEGLSIENFMSVEDDEFKVVFKNGTDTLFTGFLVQDDFTEELTDFRHYIELKATDNIALLRNVLLSDAAIEMGEVTPAVWDIEQIDIDTISVDGIVTGLQVGSVVRINGGLSIDGTYNVRTWKELTGPDRTEIVFMQNLYGTITTEDDVDVELIIPYDLTQRCYLNELMALCMKPIGIELPIRYMGSLRVPGSTGKLWDTIMITPESFSNNNTWDSCYTVLEKILSRFRASLFQADNMWNIVRWPEYIISYPNPNTWGFDSNFEYTGILVMPENEFDIGLGLSSFPETGITKTLVRPHKFDLEKFMYRNPDNLMVNADFRIIGRFVRSQTVGDQTWEDYEMYGWGPGYEWTTGGNGYVASQNERLIRIVKDADGVEIDRYGVIRGNTGFDDHSAAQSNNIEVVPGDRIRISFDYRTNQTNPGPGWDGFTAEIMPSLTNVPRPTELRRLRTDGKWIQIVPPVSGSAQILVEIPPGDNTTDWHTGSVELSDPVVVPGLFRFKLAQVLPYNSTSKETHYKNIRFEIIRDVAGSNIPIGHEHKSYQAPNIKNNSDVEIHVDNTPSNSIAGTLYLPSFTGPVQDRVKLWEYNGSTFENLGSIITKEGLFLRSITRYTLEGVVHNLVQDGKWLSQLTVFIYEDLNTRKFIAGGLRIDYKNETADCTMYELFSVGESYGDMNDAYNFRYLFNSRWQ